MTSEKTKLSIYCDWVILFSLCGIAYFLPISKAIIESLSTVAILVYIIKKIHERSLPEKSSMNLVLLVYLAVCLLTVFLSSNFKISSRTFISKTMQNALLFIIASETLNTKKRVKAVIYIFLLSSLLLGVDGIYQHFTHKDFIRNRPDFVLPRIYATFSSPGDFGCYLVTLIPFTLANLFVKAKQRFRAVPFAALFVLLFTCTLLTVSRGAWIAFIGSVLFMSIWLRWLALFLIFIGLVVVILQPYLNQYIKIRLSSFFVFLDYSSLDRMRIWDTSWRMFMSNPFLGVGLGTFMFNFTRFAGSDFSYIAYAHNCYMQIAAETGIFGLLSFLALIILFFYQGIIALNSHKRSFLWHMLLASLTAVLAYCIHIMVDTGLYAVDLGLLFWFMLGLGVALIKQVKQEVVSA